MNIHTPDIDRLPTREEAEAALSTLRKWAGKSSDEDISRLDSAVGWLVPGQGYPAFSRAYPAGFRPDAAYLRSMPDLQNGPSSLIRGAKARIQHVGISNFRLPVRFATRDGAPLVLETSVYAVPDERLGEEVGATVYSSAPLSEDALREFLAPHLARFEIPRYFHFSVEPLPRTASGKILKRELREEASTRLGV